MIKNSSLYALVAILSVSSFGAFAQDVVTQPEASTAVAPVISEEEQNALRAEQEQRLEAEFNSPILSPGDPNLESIDKRIRIVRPEINLLQIPSLFFTPSEQSLIEEARLGLTTRPPGMGGLDGSVAVGPRELALGGIVYLSQGDWTIWLNKQKITPKRLPPEILDITVRKEYIRLKWFDASTNQIFPIKLRTHQRFNLDTRIFLPGEGAQEIVSEF